MAGLLRWLPFSSWATWLHVKIRKGWFGLQSVGLKFPHPSLENQFAKTQTKTFVASYQILIVVVGVFGIATSFHQMSRCGSCAHVAFPLISALCVLIGYRPNERLARMEGKGSFVLVRLLVVFLGAWAASTMRIGTNPNQIALYEVICLKSGLLFHSLVVFGVPLMLRTNLVWGFVETGLVAAVCGPSFCSHLRGILIDLMHQTWFSMDQTALKVLEGMFGVAVHDTAVCPQEGECVQFFGFLQVFIGLFILNYLVWVRERCARVAFLTRECQREGIPPPDNSQVLGVALIVHILVFVTLFGAVWRFWGTFLAWLSA